MKNSDLKQIRFSKNCLLSISGWLFDFQFRRFLFFRKFFVFHFRKWKIPNFSKFLIFKIEVLSGRNSDSISGIFLYRRRSWQAQLNNPQQRSRSCSRTQKFSHRTPKNREKKYRKRYIHFFVNNHGYKLCVLWVYENRHYRRYKQQLVKKDRHVVGRFRHAFWKCTKKCTCYR